MKVIEVKVECAGKLGEPIPDSAIDSLKEKALSALDPTLSPERKAEVMAKLVRQLETLRGQPPLKGGLLQALDNLSQAMCLLAHLPGTLQNAAMVLDHDRRRTFSPEIYRLGGTASSIAVACGALEAARDDVEHLLSRVGADGGAVQSAPIDGDEPKKKQGN